MISIVLPVYNEESLIDNLIQRVTSTLESIGEAFEIICVDDGSSDGSLENLVAHHKKDNRIKVLKLSKNFGHQAAYTAGLSKASGNYIAMMDSDLQDPPELITDMYKHLIDGKYEVVYGRRIDRGEKGVKKIMIKLFHYIFNRLSITHSPSNVGNFSIMSKKAVKTLLKLSERNRYLPGLRYFIGFKQGHVDYKRHDRDSGESKMSFAQLSELAFDAIFSFSKLPIKLSLIIGSIGIVLSLMGTGIVIYKYIIGVAITGWTSTMLSLYFFGSVQLFFLGVLGEYVFRTYKESQGRPLYIVDEFYE